MNWTIRRQFQILALATALLPGAAQAQQQTTPSGEPASPAKPPAADGFTLQSASGESRLRFGAHVQGDGRFYLGGASTLSSDGLLASKLASSTFLLSRARPVLQATLAKRFELFMMADFGGGVALVQDAYLDARYSSWLAVQVGKFKTPFGLERLQSDSNLLFVERGLPTSIAPNRDAGVALHGELGAGRLVWALALENGVSDGGSSDADTNDGKDVVGRFFLQPFKETKGPLRGLGLGLAGQTGRQTGTVPAVYRTPGQLIFFTYLSGTRIDGTRQRFSPQGWFYVGPAGVIGEYARSSSPLAKDTTRQRVRNEAWQLAASVFLTGEGASFQPVKIARPFDPGHGAWGAVELAARVHRLSVGDEAFEAGLADPAKAARQATAWGVGLNWYLNRYVKYVVDYDHTSFRGGAAGGDRPREHTLMIRAQVSF